MPPTMKITEVKEYTVVILAPEYALTKRTSIVHILACSVLEAQDTAYLDAARLEPYPGSDYTIVAVFEGRLTDISL